MRYQNPGTKKDASEGLGPYPGVTLATAKAKAIERTRLIEQGTSPIMLRRQTAKAAAAALAAEKANNKRSVLAAVELWDKETSGKLTSAKYRAQRSRRLADLTNHIGQIAVADLTAADVATAMSAKGRDKVDTLSKSTGDLAKAIAYVESLGWQVNGDPVGVARKGLGSPETDSHKAFAPHELPAFVRDLDAAIATAQAKGSYPMKLKLLKFLLLTAARTSEVRLAEWQEIKGFQSDCPVLEIPASRMKMRLPWTIPLSAQAVAMLREIQAEQEKAGIEGAGKAGRIFIHLGGRLDRAGKPMVLSDAAANLALESIGWKPKRVKPGEVREEPKVVGHGLRKVFSTAAHGRWDYLGANRVDAIEFALAHSKKTVRNTYDRNEYMEERTLLTQWWADHLDSLSAGGNVIQFAAKAA